jgi:hypothetical protein
MSHPDFEDVKNRHFLVGFADDEYRAAPLCGGWEKDQEGQIVGTFEIQDVTCPKCLEAHQQIADRRWTS